LDSKNDPILIKVILVLTNPIKLYFFKSTKVFIIFIMPKVLTKKITPNSKDLTKPEPNSLEKHLYNVLNSIKFLVVLEHYFILN
jgi:hypothetical protein